MFSSYLPRYEISILLSSSSTLSSSARITGTTTNVRASGGTPFERSIFGKSLGPKTCVMSQLIMLTAKSLVGIAASGLEHEEKNREDGQQCDGDQRAEIKGSRVTFDRALHTFCDSGAMTNFSFELHHPVPDQKISNMRGGIVCSSIAGGLGQAQGGARNLRLIPFRAFTNAFDHVPVTIARGKVHSRIDRARIFRQFRID